MVARRQAGDRGVILGDVGEPKVRILLPEPIGRDVRIIVELRFALPQRLFRSLALGDVHRRAAISLEPAIAIKHRLGAGLGPFTGADNRRFLDFPIGLVLPLSPRLFAQPNRVGVAGRYLLNGLADEDFWLLAAIVYDNIVFHHPPFDLVKV